MPFDRECLDPAAAKLLIKCYTMENALLSPVSADPYKTGTKVDIDGKNKVDFKPFYGFGVVEFRCIWFVKGFGPSWDVSQMVVFLDQKYQSSMSGGRAALNPETPKFSLSSYK